MGNLRNAANISLTGSGRERRGPGLHFVLNRNSEYAGHHPIAAVATKTAPTASRAVPQLPTTNPLIPAEIIAIPTNPRAARSHVASLRNMAVSFGNGASFCRELAASQEMRF
jgi:hypothetical protein